MLKMVNNIPYKMSYAINKLKVKNCVLFADENEGNSKYKS